MTYKEHLVPKQGSEPSMASKTNSPPMQLDETPACESIDGETNTDSLVSEGPDLDSVSPRRLNSSASPSEHLQKESHTIAEGLGTIDGCLSMIPNDDKAGAPHHLDDEYSMATIKNHERTIASAIEENMSNQELIDKLRKELKDLNEENEQLGQSLFLSDTWIYMYSSIKQGNETAPQDDELDDKHQTHPSRDQSFAD